MKTNAKIRDNAGRLIARVTETSQVNEGVQSLAYSQEHGSLQIRHYGNSLTISGTVRGDLTIHGNVNVAKIKVGGAISAID